MTSRFILHIGANKTGSSAIQDFLRKNDKLLLEQGILVPDRELAHGGRVTGEHVFALQDMFNRTDRVALDAKFRALAGQDFPCVVISAENLSNGNNFQFFKSLMNGVDAKVVLYIRRQDELLTSSWQQWHSKRETDFNAWLILALQQIGNWHRCIEGWETAVGAGNVIVRVFQRSDLVNGDVVDDFVSLLPTGTQPLSFIKTSTVVNPSYSDIITPLVSGSEFIFKETHDNGFYTMVNKLSGDHYSKLKKVSLLSREQRNKIVEYYRPQNEAVCRKFFPGRPRLFAHVDHSQYDYLTSEQIMQRQLEFLASMVYALYNRKA